MATVTTQYALGYLLSHKPQLSRQQYKTLKGQILGGDADGAMRGLRKILQQRSDRCVSSI